MRLDENQSLVDPREPKERVGQRPLTLLRSPLFFISLCLSAQ